MSKSEYVNLLCKEIALVREKLGDFNISSIHIGGGTPTILTEKELEKLFFTLRENFNVSDEIEITCESSPETLNKDKIRFLLSLGVNRLNIGVHSFDDDILKIINRRHNSSQAKHAISLAQWIRYTLRLHALNQFLHNSAMLYLTTERQYSTEPTVKTELLI